MKQTIFFSALLFLFSTCSRCDYSGGYTVDGNPCLYIKFQGKIGVGFDEALDSLKRSHQPEFDILASEGHYSGSGYWIEKDRLNVDFPQDDRKFFRLTFIDSLSSCNYLAHSDVLDERGNYYLYIVGIED